jgi:IclR family transcriptional regulator, acetate operon repressor
MSCWFQNLDTCCNNLTSGRPAGTIDVMHEALTGQKFTLSTVTRALRFLEVVAKTPGALKVKDVAQELDMRIGTAYHIVNTLADAGYLVRAPSGDLMLGSRVALLHQALLRQFSMPRDLVSVLDQLSADVNETAYLTKLTPDGVVIQAIAESSHVVQVTGLYVGYRGWEHVRASGKAVLAFLPDAERDRLLRQALASLPEKERSSAYTHSLIELRAIANQGWSFDDRQFNRMVSCVAAPYFDAGGNVVGSVAVSVPSDRYPKRAAEFTDAVMTAARTMTGVFGLLSELSAR